jgi:hypothetical protein
MVACQVAGSLLGTRLAIRPGAALVRKLVLIAVPVSIFRTGAGAVARWAG